MHFAIVPLLVMGWDEDMKTCWLLSPCLDNGDLFTLIEKDTRRIEKKQPNTDIELKCQRRVKIVYHIIAAIDFLHTEVEKFRGAIIHLDVKTKNIVLDRFYNARLTDFGVAREIPVGKNAVDTESPTNIPSTDGYYSIEKPPTLEKYFDYFNIGVVIRELLIGKPATYESSDTRKEVRLEKLTPIQIEYYSQIQQQQQLQQHQQPNSSSNNLSNINNINKINKNSSSYSNNFSNRISSNSCNNYKPSEIWRNEKTNELYPQAEKLIKISTRCLNSATESEKNSADKMNSKCILEEIQGLVRVNPWENSETIGKKSERVSDNKEKHKTERSPPVRQETRVDENCDLCMVNPAVEKGLLSHAGSCRSPLNVCVSCMRNSYLNPLHCHSCFEEIEPIIGGSGWGAVLIAGRYDDEPKLSLSFANDIDDIEKMVVSKCPLVIGIRKVFVRTVCGSKSSQERKDVKSQIQSAFNDLKNRGVRTLFIYYSGHYDKDDGFVLERRCENADVPPKDQTISEHLSVRQLEDMLKSFGDNCGKTEVETEKSVILILDCCKPPAIIPGEDPCLNGPEIKHGNDPLLKIVQLNACRPYENAMQEPEGTGSLFKTIFIQGLTMKATGDKCFFQGDSKPCTLCPIKGDAFITIGQLASYISRHGEAYYKLKSQKPFWHVHNAMEEVNIGYMVDTSADLEFTFIFHGMQSFCTLPCRFFNEINQLKGSVFTEFMDRMIVNKEKGKQLELNADKYQDILRIYTKFGPKDYHKLELTSLEKVLSAWNGKRELIAEMREIELIKDGRVGVFKEVKKSFSFLNEEKYRKEEQDDCTIYKIDVSDYLDLHIDLPELNIAVHEQKSSELHIISPVMIDDTGKRHLSDDFVCLKIERKAIMPESCSESKPESCA